MVTLSPFGAEGVMRLPLYGNVILDLNGKSQTPLCQR